MKTNRCKYTIFLFMLVNLAQVQSQSFSYKTYGNVANYFGSAAEMKSFFDFRNGEVIAEVGAGDGENVGGFGLVSDSCTFYVQDIDTKILVEENWDKIIRKYKKAGMSSKHQFHLVVGDEKSTHLPGGIFDKIIMISAFHEFTYMDEMIADIKSKLKTGGRVFILETECIAPGHHYYTPESTIERMAAQGFTMMQRIETPHNGSKGLYLLSFYME
jgi:ubiquinone/menaquinone biosynthesis C-methylase UbiE